MSMNHFNICPGCIHRNTCVLTMQKDKVWSCSEFDETKPNYNLAGVQAPEQVLKTSLII